MTLYIIYTYIHINLLQVDKHIRRLDSDLSRFEQELQMKDLSGRRTSTASLSDLHTPTLSKFLLIVITTHSSLNCILLSYMYTDSRNTVFI